MQHPILQPLLDQLKAQGKTEEEIAQVAQELTKISFSVLYSNAIASFTAEDVKAIDEIESDEEADIKILELYTLRTEKDPYKELQQILETTMSEYQKTLPAEVATSA